MSAAVSTPRLDAADLLARLRGRFAPPEYAMFEEVGDATGGRSRSIDALVMSLWPSRGLEVLGFEIKVSRSDWKRELANPAKAEAFACFCDRWYLVVSDEKIVAPGELPPTWGLLVPRGPQLLAKVEAPKLDATPLGRPFIAAICRAAQKDAPAEAALKQARREGIEIGAAQERAKFVEGRAERDLANLTEQVAQFEAVSGIKLTDPWCNGSRVGEAVKEVLKLHHQPDYREHVRRAVEDLEQHAKRIRTLLKAGGPS